MKTQNILFLSLFIMTLLATVGCTVQLPSLQDSAEFATLTPLPTDIPVTATPVPDGAAQVGQTFYKAWENEDYVGMYSLLSPQSQALIDLNSFVQLYETNMRTATVQRISSQPLAAAQEENRATFETQVIWETSVLGNIGRTHSASLIYTEGRWGIIWNEGLIMPELVGGNILNFSYRSPSRANIYDINGKALAYQGTAILFGVVPGQIEDEAGMLATLSPLLNESPDDLRAKYADANPDWYVPLGDITADTMQENYDIIEPYIGKGLLADDRLTRIYDSVAPHLVGYMGAIPDYAVADYLSLGYQPDARVGLTGLEAWGEEYLSGTRGGVLELRTADGVYLDTLAETEPRQARSVYTTFDADFQRAVEAALAQAAITHPVSNRGAVVVLDVNTGAILAMASYPTYDPAIFDASRPNAGEEIAALFTAPQNPLLNRAAQGEYPAGSTFKIITLAAAVRSGLYTADSRYTSTGVWSRLGEGFEKVDWREGGHGTVSLRQALVVSCNTCFYDAGFEMNAADSFLFSNVARSFGLGTPTGAIGISEAPGLIPDPDWKIANTAEGGWVPGDAVNMAIGQGYVKVTPLQMAQVAGSIANGGTIYTPTLIDRIGGGGGAPEEAWPSQQDGPIPFDEYTLTQVRSAMRDVASARSGTATFVFEGLRVPVAGKTGTAQTPQPSPHAWFVGYAPAEPYTHTDGRAIETPEIAIAVIMENAGEGSEVAAPIFRRIVELYYGISPTKPYPW